MGRRKEEGRRMKEARKGKGGREGVLEGERIGGGKGRRILSCKLSRLLKKKTTFHRIICMSSLPRASNDAD